jgi:hypothetical protein
MADMSGDHSMERIMSAEDGVFTPHPTQYEIGRCADLFIAHYGAEAASMAEQRADDLRALGALKAAETWVEIKTEITRVAISA